VVIGVEKASEKMKDSFSQSIRYIELSGSPFNAVGGSNLDADLHCLVGGLPHTVYAKRNLENSSFELSP